MQQTRSSPGSIREGTFLDVVLAMVAIVAAAAAAFLIPDGTIVRWALAIPVLLVVPGYLLLQAILVPAKPVSSRGVHALLSLGISPPLVGLLALTTALFGAFHAGPIIAVVTGACLLLGVTALLRRGSAGRSSDIQTPTS